MKNWSRRYNTQLKGAPEREKSKKVSRTERFESSDLKDPQAARSKNERPADS